MSFASHTPNCPKRPMSHFWTLDSDKNPLPCDSIEEWSSWVGKSGRLVDNDYVGHIEISTVAVGINCQQNPGEPPLIFETLVTDRLKDVQVSYHYATWEEAEKGHQKIVDKLKELVANG